MRLWALVAIGLTLSLGFVAGHNHEFIPEQETKCWECHVDWPHTPTPMRSFYNIVPPEPATVGTDAFEYTITVQNGWHHEIRYLEPVMDISQAPSLKFFDGREPLLETVTGAIGRSVPDVLPEPPNILPDTSGLTAASYGYKDIFVPVGATSLRLEITETDAAFDPEIAWYVYSDLTGDEPAFGPIYSQGSPALLELTSQDDFQGVGYGNWTVEGVVNPTDRAGNPNVFGNQITFQVMVDASFDAGDQTKSILSRSLRLDAFQTSLFTWQLQSTGAPGPGELVTLTVNGTVYFKHQPASSAIDWQNGTKSIQIPVGDDGGSPRLEPAADLLIIIVPETAVGPTLITISEAIGYLSAFLIAASIVTGGMFGKASRRGLNQLFGGAKRRVAFHNFLSYGLTAAALAHTVLFLYTNIVDGTYFWTAGLLWGGIAILAMFGLGVTGALQVAMIRRWNYSTWRWTHFGLAIAAIVFTLVHLALDGAHFGDIQEWLGYSDPLDFRPESSA